MSGNTSLDGNDRPGEFIEWFKGLLITTNNTSPATNEGCIFYTDLISSNSKISLFYRNAGTAADVTLYSLILLKRQLCEVSQHRDGQ